MNPKNLSVRMDRETGALWLTEEKYRKFPRKIVELTNAIMLSLCADLVAEEGTTSVEREIQFADGTRASVTVKLIEDGKPTDGQEASRTAYDGAQRAPEAGQ